MSIEHQNKTTLVSVLTVTFSTLISLFGLLALYIGISQLLIIDSSISMIEQARMINPTISDGSDLSKTRMFLCVAYSITTLSGLLSFVSGVGMLFKKNWARLLWLLTIVLILTETAYNVAIRTIFERHNIENASVTAVVTLLLAILMYFFTRQKTRRVFEVN